ncbi:MAG: N-formylglutamate amidohydrolase, partial [Nitrospinae bacterium CG11_big_fil_rev_8_21_14_0_20_56_8]
IYGLREEVMAYVEAHVARVVIDLNRPPGERAPVFPDGVIKSHTCHGVPVYGQGMEPGEELAALLMREHYDPYHNLIRSILDSRTDLKLALDCHSMEPVGPTLGPDPGQPRPLICLGIRGGRSCPRDWGGRLAACFREEFQLPEEEVMIDRPFSGGYITQTYGQRTIPWIQVEMNRRLYLDPAWFDAKTLRMDPARLDDLRGRFRRVLENFCLQLGFV